MRRIGVFALACLALIGAAAPAAAQQRLFLDVGKELIELDPRAGSLGRVIRRSPLPSTPAVGRRVVPLAGGAFLSWVDAGELALFNTQSGTTQRIAVPGYLLGDIIGAHADGLRVVVSANAADRRQIVLVGDFKTGTVRTIELTPATTAAVPIAYAPRADRLFVVRPRQVVEFGGQLFGTQLFDIDVIDASSGARLKTLDVSPLEVLHSIATTLDGSLLFVDHAIEGGQAALSVFDVESGARQSTGEPNVFLDELDESRQRFLSTTLGLAAYSLSSLELLGRSDVIPPGPPFVNVRSLSASGQSATLFLYTAAIVNQSYFPIQCTRAALTAVDAGTGIVRQTVDLRPLLAPQGLSVEAANCRARLIRLTEPERVSGLADLVEGRRVTIGWDVALDATRYEVQIGVQAGASNLTLSAVDNRLVVDGVPPGVYYVRVRGFNPQGAGAPSQELRVVVE